MTGPATAAERPSVRDRVVVLGLGTAVAYGALTRGAFYGAGTVLLLLGAAAAARATVRGRRPPPGITTACACLGGFGLWALVSGHLAGDVAAAAPTAVLAVAAAAVAVSASGLPERPRRVLVGIVVAVAVVVAVSGWLGVALHLDPLALPSSGIWRAASTLTYANATAALLVVGLVLVAARPRTARPLPDPVTAVLLVGLVATMSRAGLLALLVACGVHVAVTRRADLPLRIAVVLPAAAPALAGLLPSLPAGAPPHPLAALAGAAAGLGVLVLSRRGTATGIVAATAVTTAFVAVALLAATPVADAGRAVRADRISASSAERADLARATAAEFGTAPLTGVGPGQLDLHYVDHAGVPVRARYTHDEFLQTAAETGVVGLAAVSAALLALARAALRGRSRDGAAAAALLAAFAVHSAFDFLWHVPVLPLLVVLVVAVLIPQHPSGRSNREHPTQDHPRGRSRGRAERGTGVVGRRRERGAGPRPAEPARG
ncbi:O-antigen ligase family protein [Pseudonocardia sichuanensis]